MQFVTSAAAGRTVSVEHRPEAIVLRVRPRLLPAAVLVRAAVFTVGATSLLVALLALQTFASAYSRSRLDFRTALYRLFDDPLEPRPHLALIKAAAALMLGLGIPSVTAGLVSGLLVRQVELHITRDGWVVRQRKSRELWRVRAAEVETVEYRRGRVVLRTESGRKRRVRGRDADMAWLAETLRWHLRIVAGAASAPAAGPEAPLGDCDMAQCSGG